MQPHRRKPARLRHPWDAPGKNTGDLPAAIRSGEGAQMKWCQELRCSLGVRPVYWGTFGVVVDVVWGLPRCVWARESTAPAQGNQSLSRDHSKGTPKFLAPLHLSPFSAPDRDRWVDSPALSARGPDLPCTTQDEAGLMGMQEGMAIHSSILARIIPWTEETGGVST